MTPRALACALCAVALVVMHPAPARAQPAATVEVTVSDPDGDPVAGVVLVIGDATVFTDEHGRAAATVSPGTLVVAVVSDWLVPLRSTITVAAGERRALSLTVRLDEAAGETIELEDTAPLTPGQAAIDAADAAREAGTGGDALKAAQHQPGVARSAAGEREIVVWGAAPRDTSILVDDVPVPALYHLGGWRSIIPTELVSRLAVDRAAFAAPWSGAIGGLVRVTTTDLLAPGPDGARSFTLAADFLDAGGVAVTRIGRARVALAGRVSYLDRVIGDAIDVRVRERIVIPRWGDAQLVVQAPTSATDRVDVLVLAGGDRLRRALTALDPAATKSDRRRADFLRASVAWRRRLPDGETRLRAWVGADVDERDQRFGPVPAGLHQRTTLAGARAERRATLGPVVTLIGIDASASRARVTRSGSLSIPTREGDLSVFGQPPGDDLAADAWSALTAGAGVYAQLDWVHRLVTLSPGLRVDGWALGASRVTPRAGTTPAIGWQRVLVTADPRLAATMRRGRFAAGAAVGLHHQARRADDTSAVFGTPTLGLEHAWHATATVAARLGPGDLELTAWGRRQDALVAREPSATPPLAATLTQEGRGRGAGVELVARLRRWHGLSGWAAYGLSRSERRDHDVRAWRRFEHDQTHQLTVAATWTRGRWSAATRFRLATGAPRTDVVGSFWDAARGRYQPITGAIYGVRLPDFIQLDVRGERTFTLGGSQLAVFLELENVTGRANAEELVWSGDYRERGYLTGLPFLVLAGARWSW